MGIFNADRVTIEVENTEQGENDWRVILYADKEVLFVSNKYPNQEAAEHKAIQIRSKLGLNRRYQATIHISLCGPKTIEFEAKDLADAMLVIRQEVDDITKQTGRVIASVVVQDIEVASIPSLEAVR